MAAGRCWVCCLLKSLIAIEHRKWLERLFGNEKPYGAMERCIMITHWAGEAWIALNGERNNKLQKSCWTATGCLITADSSDDKLLKPEGLENYHVPPPSVIDATTTPTASNIGSVESAEPEEDIEFFFY